MFTIREAINSRKRVVAHSIDTEDPSLALLPPVNERQTNQKGLFVSVHMQNCLMISIIPPAERKMPCWNQD